MRRGTDAGVLFRKAAALSFAALRTAGCSLLIACATVNEGPLAARELPVEKRYDFLATHGAGSPPEIRRAFMEAMVVRGMPREWVLELYGRPDRISDLGWEYLDRRGNLVLGMIFADGTVDSVVTILRPR